MKTLITRIKRLALALCFVTPLVSWAATEMTNPVTGETETYANTFTGSDGEWNDVSNWSSDTIPLVSGGNFDSSLVDGATAYTSTQINGWTPRVGAYNGATIQWNGGIGKIQTGSVGAWLTADATSTITIASFGGNQLEGSDTYPLKLSSANAGGITWSAGLTSASSTSLPFWYYLKGAGTVVYGGNITVANAQVIKMADVTLSGDSRVASKTLVTFGSGTTATFTAAADIKVYDGSTLKETVGVTSVRSAGTAIVDTSSTLTISDAVGSCEIVQCTDGIVLYYVDGDPSSIVAKTYKPSISVNFTSGTALSTAADVGVGDYAIPGTSWNNLIGDNGTLSTVTQVDSTGAASTVAGVGVTISGTRGYWACSSVTAATDLRQGYIDDSGSYTSPQVVVSGIPYYSYYAVVYFSNNGANVPFGYVTINGTNYKWDSENSELVECEGTSSDSWGASSPTAWTEGGNYIVTPTIVNSDGNFTIVSHRLSTSIRSGIAAIQIVEVPKTAEEGELVINVSGDTPYTVSEDATYTTVYVTGAGTLAFDGKGTITTTTLNVGVGATVPMGSSIVPTTVTGAGTVVYDGAQPSTTLGFDDSDNWFGTVWVKNVGDTSKGEATDAKVTTRLGSDTTDATSNELNKWGNANSFVKFTNVRAFMAKADVPWTLVLEDDDTNYAWYNNEGWSARSITIAGLKGDGTFWDINDGGCRPYLNFGDVSQFTGTIKALGKQVFLNDTTNTGDASSGLAGRITVPANQTLTVPSGKTWHTRNGLVVNGTLNVNGTLASESTTSAVSGSGTVVFTGSAPSPTGDAWWKNSAWTGTVQMKSVTLVGTDLAFNDYGNTGSVLELNGCSGWLTPAYTCTVPLKITGTLTLNDGYSGKSNAFKVGTLLGDGTISGSSKAPTMVFNVTDDCSNFTGKVQLNNKCVVFGSTIPDSLTEGRIYIAEGAQVTVQNTAEAGWWAVGGIQVDGELRANSLARFGGGTTITTTDTGVFTLVSNSDTDDMNVDYTRIQGTGTLKFEGSAYRCISTNNFPTAMIVENNLNNGLIHRIPNLEVTIGSLSGSGQMRSDWGGSGSTGDRDLRILQAKDTTYSGLFASTNDRIDEVYVAPGESTAGTLTLSGAQTASNGLIVETGASVNLTGTWKGATTVAGTIGGTGTLTGDLTFSNGATFKAFAADDADGLFVSGTVGYPAEGKVTVDVSAIEPETDVALLKAADLDASKFALADGTTEGYSLDVVDGVLTLKVPVTEVTITVPEVPNTTVTVANGGETIGTAAGNYEVAPGSVVTVTYAAASGYAISGTTEYTIDTSKNETTFEITDTATAQYVAQIRTGATTYEKYTTLADALDSANIAYGITLLADVTETAVVVDSAVNISGNNHTINANVTIANGGQLTLMFATLNGTLTIQDGGTYKTLGGTLGNVVVQDGGIINLTTLSEDAAPLTVSTLTVNGALTIVSTYGDAVRGKTYKAISYATGSATIAEGASFNGSGEWSASTVVDGDNTVVCLEITKVAVVDGVYYDTAQEAVEAAVSSGKQAQFLVQPGTVTLGAGETLVVKGGYQPTVALDAGLSTPPYEVESGYDITTGIYTYAVKSYVAQIGNTKYESLADAVDAATSGDTVTLLANTTVEARILIEKSLTIDLGGKTITRTADPNEDNGSVFRVKGSYAVTIRNGAIDCSGVDDSTVVSDGVYAIDTQNGAALVLETLTVTVNSQAGACVYPWAGSTVLIKSGTYTNTTTAPYQHKSGWMGMAVNQANKNKTGNEAVQLITIEGGTFSKMDPSLGDDSWADGEGTFVAAGYESTEDNGVWVVAALPNYTVTFDADGGTPAPAAQTVQKGSTATVPTAPTKEDYTFSGWTLGGSAYDFATPVTGNITLVASWTAVSSGIDPTDPESKQEVVIEPTGDADADKETAIAQAEVTVPETAKTLVDETTYKSYFKLQAVETSTSGTYEVSIVDLADDVKEEVAETAAEAIATNAVDEDGKVTVTVKPGLYYGFDANEDLGSLVEPTLELATGTSIKVQKPGTTKGFIKVKIGTSAN